MINTVSKNFEVLIAEANRKLKTADHLIYVTYPLLKEEKLFIKIIELISDALQNCIKAALFHDYYWKRIELANFDYTLFKERRKIYNLNEDEIKFFEEIFMILEKHKKAPVEFIRKKEFVILEENLATLQLSSEKVRGYLFKAKSIVEKVQKRLRY